MERRVSRIVRIGTESGRKVLLSTPRSAPYGTPQPYAGPLAIGTVAVGGAKVRKAKNASL